ncbi:MAG: GntR family transcriptional regulator [Alphaproteobacteria bacterium]|nr:GntR family transcriptional regulator [Alphaproteobacteria bacterium]
MTRAASRSAADLPADGDESLTARAYRIIERSLIVGGLRPGDVLSEPALMAATGCGRTPVREAIQRLARAHLLTIVPYHGAFVAPVDPRTQMKVLEMRRELDPVVAAAACRRVDAAARRRLHGLAARLRRGLADGDNLVVVEVDGEFKRLLLRLCGNPHLARTMEPVYAVARRFYFSTVVEPDLEVGRRHIAHIERVAGGDPAAAAAAASDFVAAIDALTRAAMMTSALR